MSMMKRGCSLRIGTCQKRGIVCRVCMVIWMDVCIYQVPDDAFLLDVMRKSFVTV